MADRNLTMDELAERYRTSRNTIKFWRHTGYGPQGFKVGRHVLYRESDCDAFDNQLRRDQALNTA